MKLRNQVLTLSLVTLLVPWSGWQLVQELEGFLRAGQEHALLASARTVAQALPLEFQSELLFGRERLLPVRDLETRPRMDGYADEWPASGEALEFRSEDGQLGLEVLAGRYEGRLYLFCRVQDATPVREEMPAASAASDGLLLYVRSARGLVGFRIHTAAPGPLTLDSQTEGGGQLAGHWLDRADGYDLELALPLKPGLADLSVAVLDVEPTPAGPRQMRELGTLTGGVPSAWLSLSTFSLPLQGWLAGVIPPGSRAWVLDRAGWVMAQSGAQRLAAGRTLSWAERVIYRLVAGSRTQLENERPAQMVRFEDALAAAALAGEEARHWAQDPDNARVTNAVAVPILLQGQVRGAVVIEAATDGLLLVTNRALGRLLLITLFLTIGLAAGLWFFATRLSRRVQRLSAAVSRAMDDTGQPPDLPLTAAHDELGELARNNARLLRAVADYTAYLKKLAGRLSHELQTPLAITRSSLDNLADQTLAPEAQRYAERAREGVERQAAIVRAMSEASRLEAAVKSLEWERVDLAALLRQCVEGYRELHPGRRIELELPARPCERECAPDLIAQALDKLVENAVSLTGVEHGMTVALVCGPGACEIRVANSGTRLPDILPGQLFDSLVSLRERGQGRHLGFGLHIVRLVAEAHGGAVRAENLPGGEGVRFTLVLGPD